jgi:hypothetical protein
MNITIKSMFYPPLPRSLYFDTSISKAPDYPVIGWLDVPEDFSSGMTDLSMVNSFDNS